MKYIVGYSYESFNGSTIKKAVICKNYGEYLRVKNIIKSTEEVELIEFDQVVTSDDIPNE